jgi:hypothetical protein
VHRIAHTETLRSAETLRHICCSVGRMPVGIIAG